MFYAVTQPQQTGPWGRANMREIVRQRIGRGIEMTRRNWCSLLTAAPLAAALGAPALGADMAVKAPLVKAPVAPPYSWTGWYIGANAGYGVGQGQGTFAFGPGTPGPAVETFNAMPGGAFGGGQLGFNYQFNAFVLGAETDIQGAGISDNRTCLLGCIPGSSALIDQKLNWFGTTRARVGLATGPVLTYATAGVAYGGIETGLTTTLGGTTSSSDTSTTKTGWTWGTGVEAALGGNWTAKAEYLYVDLGSSSVSTTNILPAGVAALPPFVGTFGAKNREQIFRGGINYRFGPDQTAAIAPTYNWAGLFVGGTFGFGIGRNDSTLTVPANSAEAFFLSPRGFDAGGIVGYNWQFGSWVVGLDADIQGSTGSGYLTCVNFCDATGATTIDQKLSWFSTVRGRLGYAVGPALFYATGGAAFGEVKESIAQAAAGSLSFSHRQSGFAVGGGIENKLEFFGLLGPNWTTRTEYLYVDLGSVSDTFANPAVAGGAAQTLTSNLHEHVWRTVVSYKFGGP
jgi:outer membrane immunogenic protein